MQIFIAQNAKILKNFFLTICQNDILKTYISIVLLLWTACFNSLNILYCVYLLSVVNMWESLDVFVNYPFVSSMCNIFIPLYLWLLFSLVPFDKRCNVRTFFLGWALFLLAALCHCSLIPRVPFLHPLPKMFSTRSWLQCWDLCSTVLLHLHTFTLAP